MKKERVINAKRLSPNSGGGLNEISGGNTGGKQRATSRNTGQSEKRTPINNRNHRRTNTGVAGLPFVKDQESFNKLGLSKCKTQKMVCGAVHTERRCPLKKAQNTDIKGQRRLGQVASGNSPRVNEANSFQVNAGFTTLPFLTTVLDAESNDRSKNVQKKGQRGSGRTNPDNYGLQNTNEAGEKGQRSLARGNPDNYGLQTTDKKEKGQRRIAHVNPDICGLQMTSEIEGKGQRRLDQVTSGNSPRVNAINGSQVNMGFATLPFLTTVLDSEFDGRSKNKKEKGQRDIAHTNPGIYSFQTTNAVSTSIEEKTSSAYIRTRARQNLVKLINTNFNSPGLFGGSSSASLRRRAGTEPRDFLEPRGDRESKQVRTESNQGSELPLVTFTDEELEDRQREKKKSDRMKAKLRKLRKSRPEVEESKLSTLFESDTETRARMLSILEGEYGDHARAVLKRKLRAEVFRVYRIEREKVTKGGKFFVAASEKNIEAANNLAKACVYYELTPRQFVRYWQDPKNNFTSMPFPPLTFIGASTNVDTVVCTLTPIMSQAVNKSTLAKGASILGHTYDSVDLHPDLRQTLLDAGHDLSRWDNRALMSVQNFAINTYYDWPIEEFDPEIQPLIRTARPLYAERAGGK